MSKVQNCSPEREINILLLGQTGVGKSTFINAFVNYLAYDNLNDALDNLQVIIPFSLTYGEKNTFEEKYIKIGEETTDENLSNDGHSRTQNCRSFVFPFGDRNLRLIDTPGFGDTRGIEQDKKNLFEIFSYVSHFEHLNGICILLKPDEQRLVIFFRLCIREIFRQMNLVASDNFIFIFTNARSTHYIPGGSKRLLERIINEFNDEKTKIPFGKQNTFMFDNEPIRYVALKKNGIEMDNEELASYESSWNRTVLECKRFVKHISTLPLHAVANCLSLNEAEKTVRIIARPLAETLRLIEKNIQIAKEYENSLKSKKTDQRPLIQCVSKLLVYRCPLLVCTNKNCVEISTNEKNRKVIKWRCCQYPSYLSGVVQETMDQSQIILSKTVHKSTGLCSKCNCSHKQHINTSYTCEISYTEMAFDDKKKKIANESLEVFIRKHIESLINEKETITRTYKILSEFLHMNAIHPLRDEFTDYLQLMIHEEKLKEESHSENDPVVIALNTTKENCERDIEEFKQHLTNDRKLEDPASIFAHIGKLYHLPINGRFIREQTDHLKYMDQECVKKQEKRVEIPAKSAMLHCLHV